MCQQTYDRYAAYNHKHIYASQYPARCCSWRPAVPVAAAFEPVSHIQIIPETSRQTGGTAGGPIPIIVPAKKAGLVGSKSFSGGPGGARLSLGIWLPWLADRGGLLPLAAVFEHSLIFQEKTLHLATEHFSWRARIYILKPSEVDELIADLVLLNARLIELGMEYRNGEMYLTDLEARDI